MKKHLLASIALAGCCLSAFGQGQVLFQNFDNSSAGITVGGTPTGSGLVVQLFWYNGSSFVLEDTFTSTFTGNGQNGQYPGHFSAGLVNIPQSGLQTFKVAASYDFYQETTGPFVSQVKVPPGQAPEGIDLGPPTGSQAGGWNGNLELAPEPSTMALGGLGAAVWLLFRRRK